MNLKTLVVMFAAALFVSLPLRAQNAPTGSTPGDAPAAESAPNKERAARKLTKTEKRQILRDLRQGNRLSRVEVRQSRVAVRANLTGSAPVSPVVAALPVGLGALPLDAVTVSPVVAVAVETLRFDAPMVEISGGVLQLANLSSVELSRISATLAPAQISALVFRLPQMPADVQISAGRVLASLPPEVLIAALMTSDPVALRLAVQAISALPVEVSSAAVVAAGQVVNSSGSVSAPESVPGGAIVSGLLARNQIAAKDFDGLAAALADAGISKALADAFIARLRGE